MSKEREFRVILDTVREKKKHFGRGDKHLTVLHFSGPIFCNSSNTGVLRS